MHVADMKEDKLTQDNESLTFTQLGLAAALVVNRMRNAQAMRELNDDIHSVNFLESASVSGPCLGGVVITTEVDAATNMVDGRSPRLPLFDTTHTLKSGRVAMIASPVGLINHGGNVTKIAEAVIQSVAIDVINHSGGPYAIHVQPNNPMRKIHFAEDSDLVIGTIPETTSGLIDGAPTPTLLPPQLASVGDVVQFGPDFFSGDHQSGPTKDEQEQRQRDTGSSDKDEKRAEDHREAVDHRLKELRAFERKAAGIKNGSGR
jgi:hypothetical protein